MHVLINYGVMLVDQKMESVAADSVPFVFLCSVEGINLLTSAVSPIVRYIDNVSSLVCHNI